MDPVMPICVIALLMGFLSYFAHKSELWEGCISLWLIRKPWDILMLKFVLSHIREPIEIKHGAIVSWYMIISWCRPVIVEYTLKIMYISEIIKCKKNINVYMLDDAKYRVYQLGVLNVGTDRHWLVRTIMDYCVIQCKGHAIIIILLSIVSLLAVPYSWKPLPQQRQI